MSDDTSFKPFKSSPQRLFCIQQKLNEAEYEGLTEIE